MASAGLSFDTPIAVSGALRWRYVGRRPLVESARVTSKATGLLNGQIGYDVNRRVRVRMDVLNLLDTDVSDTEYFYASRLRGEPIDGVEDVHSHPAAPRTIRASLAFTF